MGCSTDGPENHVPPEVQSKLTHIETLPMPDRWRSRATEGGGPSTQSAEPSPEESPTTAPAGRESAITLPEVRAAVLANNLDLRVELMNPEISQETVHEEEAKFEPLVFGSATYSRNGRTGFEDVSQYQIGLDVPLVTGGTASLSLPLRRSTDEPRYDSSLRFSVSQPLLRNAGVRTRMHSIRIARLGKGTVDARTKLQAIRILANADRVYWLLYAARAELRVRRQQYDLALRQLDEARKRTAAQAAARIEITRAQSGVASRREAIILSQTAVRRRERDLKRIMRRPDLPVESPDSIVPVTDPEPLRPELSRPLLTQHALANRMELLELELQLAIDASNIDFARNQALPLFVLDYSYNVSGSGNSARGSFDAAGEDGSYDWFVQLRAEVPVGNEAARAGVQRAILQRVQRLSTRELRRTAIEQEVYDAADKLDQDWERILAARNEAVFAGRTYEAERRQFELAVRTSTDVLDAAERLANAQSREIQAVVDYHLSLIDLAFATGALFGHGRVHLAPVSDRALVSDRVVDGR